MLVVSGHYSSPKVNCQSARLLTGQQFQAEFKKRGIWVRVRADESAETQPTAEVNQNNELKGAL